MSETNKKPKTKPAAVDPKKAPLGCMFVLGKLTVMGSIFDTYEATLAFIRQSFPEPFSNEPPQVFRLYLEKNLGARHGGMNHVLILPEAITAVRQVFQAETFIHNRVLHNIVMGAEDKEEKYPDVSTYFADDVIKVPAGSKSQSAFSRVL